MPVRLTSRGPFLISYDSRSDSWVTIQGIDFCILPQYVDIEPGTTLGRVFDMVDTNKDLKRFLAEYCGCDIDTIHSRPRESGKPIQVTAHENVEGGGIRAIGVNQADEMVILPHFWVYTDEATNERRLDGGHDIMAGSSKNRESCLSIHNERETAFGFLCGLELRIDPIMRIYECDEDNEKPSDEDTIALEATIRYTLLEVLVAVYQFFGEPSFDQRYQPDVDRDNEFLDQIQNSGTSMTDTHPEDENENPEEDEASEEPDPKQPH